LIILASDPSRGASLTARALWACSLTRLKKSSQMDFFSNALLVG
jgi:hypothetical protein